MNCSTNDFPRKQYGFMHIANLAYSTIRTVHVAEGVSVDWKSLIRLERCDLIRQGWRNANLGIWWKCNHPNRNFIRYKFHSFKYFDNLVSFQDISKLIGKFSIYMRSCVFWSPNKRELYKLIISRCLFMLLLLFTQSE